MKYEDARETVRKLHFRWICTSGDNVKYLVLEALEKQIPKSPCYSVDHIGPATCECGCVLMTGQQYCSKCGQRVDWSDAE